MSTAATTGRWRRIAVTTPHAAVAEAVFEYFHAAAISELDAGSEPTLEAVPATRPAFDKRRMVGLFPFDTPVADIKQALLQALGDDVVIEVDELANRDWAEAWTAHHPPLHFGGRLWVAPHNAAVHTQADVVVVRLDPGLAFGTGTHPTTALCLTWLAHADLSGCSVLDYGCGSGILAIAAGRLGARRVAAVDIDDQAVRATRANAAANGADYIETPDINELGTQPRDIVLANILARPLIDLVPTLSALTRPGGRLVLSGLLRRQGAEVRAAYEHCFGFAPPAQQDDWIRLDGARNAACSV